ncbi:MAG: hypothetical protein COB46_04835 [Rhodospirillaceae bacterium]|nr:MAG: hypothetical protein COB46_04835 [Rhodospirillaceae bacterium]
MGDNRYKELVEQISDWLWEVDENACYTYASPKIYDLLGHAPEDVIGKTPFDLMSVEEADRIGKIIGPIFQNREPFSQLENVNRHLDGRRVILETSGVPFFDEDGTFKGYRGIDRDITHRKQIETELADKATELKSQQFALDVHAIVSITDVEGKIHYANQKFCDISGYSVTELQGQNHRIIKSDEHPPEFFKEMWQTISQGDVWQGEIKNTAKCGRAYWVMSTIVPSLNAKGKPFQYISIRTDITERKTAELKAITANRTKSDLMANMSHELRTPLNAIIGFSAAIRSQVFGELGHAKYAEYIEDIHYSGQHLLDLINDILDVSAIEAGAINLQEELVSIYEVVETSIRLIRPKASQNAITISSLIDENTPRIFADERRLKQIFLNLLSNAVKFTPKRGDVITSSWLNEVGDLVISVADTGIGMDEAEIRTALSVFGQVDSGLDRQHEGSGLGLPLTVGLVETHGGRLDIKSDKGHGTQVLVTFPKDRLRPCFPA